MANFTALKNITTVNQVVAGMSHAVMSIDPSKLATYPASTDTIEFFDLPAGARIWGGWINISATVGAATSTLKVQAKINGTTTDMTATIAADGGATGKILNGPTPLVDLAHVTTIQAVVGTAALNAAGLIEIGIAYSV